MTLGEVKDQVREHFGRIGWPTTELNFALGSARRDIEKYSNFYWMRDVTTFDLADGTQTYAIGSALAVNEANFKDARALHVKETGDTVWTEVELGTVTLEEAFLMFPTDEETMPLLAVLDNATLYMFPTPDKTYNAKLFHWNWTSNPSAGNTGSDELTERFPEALIYGALIWGFDQFDKAHEQADKYRALFAQEVAKIHRHAIERERMDRVSFVPMTGPYQNRSLTRLNRQVWL
jgi:hypothetical protein